MSDKKTYYAVLSLRTEIKVEDQLGRIADVDFKKSEMTGYIPVFSTFEKALENSGDGKFQIMPIIEVK